MKKFERERKTFLPFSDENAISEPNGHPFHGFEDDEEVPAEEFGLTDELDHEILMHRDAHFGGDFQVMINYYHDEGVGMHPNIDLERIVELSEIEKEIGQDLAPLLLTGSEAEKVARARRAYEQFKEIYLIEEEKSPIPRLIADLILSEEETPEQEMEAIVAQGTKIVPELINLVQLDDAYDPLFPGYGYAPYFAIVCLGKIGDPRAIEPLFETIGKETYFDEHVIIEALRAIGEPAKHFLLKVLKGRPLTKDTANAALALSMFSDDQEVAETAFKELKNPDILKMPLLRSYLLYCCEGLKGTPFAREFAEMASNPELPADLKTEMKIFLKEWKF